jgi:hypothetical protein
MKKSANRKLVVRGETVRALDSLRLRKAVGGADTGAETCFDRKLDLSLALCTTKP